MGVGENLGVRDTGSLKLYSIGKEYRFERRNDISFEHNGLIIFKYVNCYLPMSIRVSNQLSLSSTIIDQEGYKPK